MTPFELIVLSLLFVSQLLSWSVLFVHDRALEAIQHRKAESRFPLRSGGPRVNVEVVESSP